MTLYAPADWWPEATRRDVSYWPDAGPFTQEPIGLLEHVVVGNGSPWQTFEDAVSPNRRFSHWWIAKNGDCEQYGPCSYMCWAAEAGDLLYYSAEFEGYPNEPLTGAQIATAARLYKWLRLRVVLAEEPGQPGLGTHAMGGAAYGGHPCPDATWGLPGPRSRQRPAILALVTGGPMSHDPLDTTDLTNIARTEESYYQVRLPDGSMEVRDLAIGEILANSRQVLANTAAILAALKLPVSVTVDPDKLAAAVTAGVAAQIKPALVSVLNTAVLTTHA